MRSRTGFILESPEVDILSAEFVGGALDPIPCILVRFHLLTAWTHSTIPARIGFLLDRSGIHVRNTWDVSRSVS